MCLAIRCCSFLWKLCKTLFWCKTLGKGIEYALVKFLVPFLVNNGRCPNFLDEALMSKILSQNTPVLHHLSNLCVLGHLRIPCKEIIYSKQWVYQESMINKEIYGKSTKMSRKLFVSKFTWILLWCLSGFHWWFWCMMLVHFVLIHLFISFDWGPYFKNGLDSCSYFWE